MKTTSLAFVTALALTASIPMDVGACALLRDGPKGRVTQVIDGDTVLLDNGLKVRLIGIQAPKLALGREDFQEWPLANEAKDALEALALGKNVVLKHGGADRDRHGRVLAHGFVGEQAVWIQKHMLAAGLARVYSFADNRACLEELYQAEAVARAEGVGIWSHAFYGLRRADRPENLLPLEGHYELVEGRVLQAERAGGRIYLNFGRVWREDFTVVIERAGQKVFESSEIDPLELAEAFVRVRGWVDAHDGPRMVVTHPEQIEVLSAR